MNLAVTVLHNVGQGMFWPYDPATASLHHAHTFQVITDGPNEAAHLVWDLANCDPDDLSGPIYGMQVREYRDRMNRSLSVGDVMVMHELTPEGERIAGVYAVEPVGWRGLEFVPEYEDGSNQDAASASYLAHTTRFAS